MSELRGYLFNGEEVAQVVRPHPIVLLKPSIAPLAAVALVAATPNRFTFVVLLVMLVRFGWDVGLWYVDRYVLTTDRIVSLSGIFTTKVVSMPLTKITDLTYARTLMGRLLGYGTLDLESAGQQGLERIEFLPDPDDFYRAVMSLALGPPPAQGQDLSHVGEEPEPVHHRPRPVVLTDDPVAERPPVRMNPDGLPENTDQIPRVRSVRHSDD